MNKVIIVALAVLVFSGCASSNQGGNLDNYGRYQRKPSRDVVKQDCKDTTLIKINPSLYNYFCANAQ